MSCDAGKTCCGAGCCGTGAFCCDPALGNCCPNGWNCRNGRCCEGPWCGDTCCFVGETCCGEACCSSGQVCCLGPDHCCNAGTTCCPGGTQCCYPDQTCCHGVCGLKGACCFFDSGSCSELTALCCQEQGGTYQGGGTTCTPPDLCRPRCENCQSFTRNFAECVHFVGDPNGTPCSTTECIENRIETATCTFYPVRSGPPKCDTQFSASTAWAWQWVRTMPCPAQNVSWNTFLTPYEGCGTNCTGWDPPRDSCLVGACIGNLVGGPFERLGKRVCGCP